MAPLPAGYSSRNDSSLSLRTRRNMNEEEEHLIDQDFTEQDHFLEKETTNATRRARGFWDVDEDFDDEELGEPHHHHQIQHKRSLWFHLRFAFIGIGIGLLFLILKLSVMAVGHHGEHMRPVERLYFNGTHQFAPTLILISLDGFRNDYLERNVTPHLSEFASQGIRAEYMNPSFPSITFPNHWTLATGLYPEAHGIVGNEFYDPHLQSMFIHKQPKISSQSQWWGGEPIWTTSKRQGRKSAVIMWPGSPVPKFEPDYLVDYERGITAQHKMETALGWLDMPFEQRPQMISIYVPQVDQKGHGGGPEGGQLNGVLAQMDDAVGFLLQGLKERNLDTHVNVVIVSDHGMAQTDKSRLVFYEDILSKETLSHLRPREAWPLLSLRPKDDAPEDTVKRVYDELYNYTQSVDDAHFQVYLREDVPERFHYRGTERIAPVVTIPDVGYSIISHRDYDINSGKPYRPMGIHGYDNLAMEMRAIFMARGPRIEQWYNKGTIVAPFFNVEVYGFVAKILNLDPAPNNGTLNGEFVPVA